MRFKIVFVLCFAVVASASGQQLQVSSLYDLQGIFYNPSMAGTQGKQVGITYRTQWSGISGNPKTATAFGSFDLPQHKLGLGGYVYNDKTGYTSRTGLAVQFAKHIPFSNGGKFSVGIEARGLQYAIDKAGLSQTLGADPAIAANDNKFMFDVGFGISYTDSKWQLGASVAQLVQSKLKYYSGGGTRNEEGRLYRHYYFHGAYKWDVDGFTNITPNFLVVYLPNAPTEYQFGARIEHNELFWWGLGYRVKQSVMLSAGVNISKKFTVGYAFDIYNTPLSEYDGGGNAHEFLLRYKFSDK